MIHGGLRYLENGEIDLVRESLRERDALLRMRRTSSARCRPRCRSSMSSAGSSTAPSACSGCGAEPAERGALAVKTGLTFYDFLSRPPDHAAA